MVRGELPYLPIEPQQERWAMANSNCRMKLETTCTEGLKKILASLSRALAIADEYEVQAGGVRDFQELKELALDVLKNRGIVILEEAKIDKGKSG